MILWLSKAKPESLLPRVHGMATSPSGRVVGGGGPLKTNIEPKNHLIEKENPRPKPSFLGSSS